MKPYKATHKFPEGLKYENDEVILQLPRGIQGATKASTSRFGATKTPNFWLEVDIWGSIVGTNVLQTTEAQSTYFRTSVMCDDL